MTMRIHHAALWLSLSGLGPSPNVRPGLDVLVTDSLHLVLGRRVGLVANQASVDQHGVHAVERLRAAGVTLVALFSPEHGFRGGADPGEEVPTTVDSATGSARLNEGPRVLSCAGVVKWCRGWGSNPHGPCGASGF